MTLKVVHAEPSDAAAIADFNQAMALETEHLQLDPVTLRTGVETMLNDPELGFYLVARKQPANTTVACLGVTFEWSDWRNGLFWWIQSVYVAPDSRGEGVFSTMYEKVRQMAMQDDRACGIRLYVEKDNQRAMRTYGKLGMFETEYRLMEETFNRTD